MHQELVGPGLPLTRSRGSLSVHHGAAGTRHCARSLCRTHRNRLERLAEIPSCVAVFVVCFQFSSASRAYAFNRETSLWVCVNVHSCKRMRLTVASNVDVAACPWSLPRVLALLMVIADAGTTRGPPVYATQLWGSSCHRELEQVSWPAPAIGTH